jgi:hypothetical protein
MGSIIGDRRFYFGEFLVFSCDGAWVGLATDTAQAALPRALPSTAGVGPVNATDLSLERIMLSSGGVGYFEYEAVVDGNEFRELAAFVVSQRDRILVEETDELIAKTSPDQLVVNGIASSEPPEIYSGCFSDGGWRANFLNTRSKASSPFSVSSAPSSRAMSMKRLDCSGSSGGGLGLRAIRLKYDD